MIQELLGGGGGVGVRGAEDQRKISIIGGGVVEGSSVSSTSSSDQNLRCPRCDSSNTKFCYYNNYNLTQPRHFCKTCRRYWTKGGALRNVPIGGGCRKNKSSSVSIGTAKSCAGKSKPAHSDIGRPNFASGFDQDQLPSNPILWPTSHNSELLALLRAAQNPNPNLILNSVAIKEGVGMLGSHLPVETNGFSATTLGLDQMSQVPQVPISLCNSLWRNNHSHQQQSFQNPLKHTLLLGEAPNNGGIQELYQRLRSSGNYYSNDQSQAIYSNAASSSSSSIMETAAASAGDLGCWNAPFSWPDLSTAANGAFP